MFRNNIEAVLVVLLLQTLATLIFNRSILYAIDLETYNGSKKRP